MTGIPGCLCAHPGFRRAVRVGSYCDPGTVESMVTRTALMVPVMVATGGPEALISSVPSQLYTFRV